MTNQQEPEAPTPATAGEWEPSDEELVQYEAWHEREGISVIGTTELTRLNNAATRLRIAEEALWAALRKVSRASSIGYSQDEIEQALHDALNALKGSSHE